MCSVRTPVLGCRGEQGTVLTPEGPHSPAGESHRVGEADAQNKDGRWKMRPSPGPRAFVRTAGRRRAHGCLLVGGIWTGRAEKWLRKARVQSWSPVQRGQGR